jgi:hypothetical protein
MWQKWWTQFLSKMEPFDTTMIELFQKIPNRTGVSNYRIAGICCWLAAFTLYLWVKNNWTTAALWFYVLLSGCIILGIFVFKSLEDDDSETPGGIWMGYWRDVSVGGVIRTGLTILIVSKLGGNMYTATLHDSTREWALIGLSMLLIPIMYLAAGLPPHRRKKIPVRKNNKK